MLYLPRLVGVTSGVGVSVGSNLMGVPNTGSGVSVGVGGGVFVGSSFCGSGVVVSTNGYGVLVEVGTIVPVGTGMGVSVGAGAGVSLGGLVGVSVGVGGRSVGFEAGVSSQTGSSLCAWAMLTQNSATITTMDKIMAVFILASLVNLPPGLLWKSAKPPLA